MFSTWISMVLNVFYKFVCIFDAEFQNNLLSPGPAKSQDCLFHNISFETGIQESLKLIPWDIHTKRITTASY